MRRYFWLITILVIFLFTLGILVYFIMFKTSTTGKVSNINKVTAISTSNSYIFASPIRAKIDGDLLRVTVFLLDESGLGIVDKKVKLSTDDSVTINDVQTLTDQTGRAFFDLGGTKAGSYKIEAIVDGTTLNQYVSVIFDGEVVSQ